MAVIPFVIANEPAGTNTSPLLDANFASLQAQINSIATVQAPRGYLGGMILSNDGVTPNTVLDISAGQATDSTNTQNILAAALTKSTQGSWAAGTGNNGMGAGLTIAVSTWYHVFAIINAGIGDYYFDTSITAANSPPGTSAFRRIGSFKTDSSAHIMTFVQDGDWFQWLVPIADVGATNPGTSAVARTLSVPPGVHVGAIMQFIVTTSNVAATVFGYLSDLATTSQGAGGTLTDTSVVTNAAAGVATAGTRLMVRTNTASQIRSIINFSDANTTIYINTLGWMDTRGRDA